MKRVRPSSKWLWGGLLLVAVFAPLAAREWFAEYTRTLSFVYITGLAVLGLHIIVGNTGLLHLGMAAFFGLGVYITGIVNSPVYPFQYGFIAALILSGLGSAAVGVMLAAPTLRLRGDYLAIVTLGFGEVVRFTLKNLEEITNGTRGINPISPPEVAGWAGKAISLTGVTPDFVLDDRMFYYLNLILVLAAVWLVRNLERSPLGRAWLAVREDELAATCMGINAARVKLSAFALGTGLAGMAGCLFATILYSTAEPNTYDFNRSITFLCCIIVGGLGSLRGAILGTLLVESFDKILVPKIDAFIQGLNIDVGNSEFWQRMTTFSNWKLIVFGLALVLIMRFRPQGLVPAVRAQDDPPPLPPGESPSETPPLREPAASEPAPRPNKPGEKGGRS